MLRSTIREFDWCKSERFSFNTPIAYRQEYEFKNIMVNQAAKVILRNDRIASASEVWDFEGVGARSNLTNEGIEIAPGPTRVDPNGLSIQGPEGRYAKAGFRRRRNRAFLLSFNERRLTISAPRFPLYRRKKENARVRERALQSSEPNGAIIRTFANQLDERCENCRRETLPLSLFSLSFSLVCLVHWAQL